MLAKIKLKKLLLIYAPPTNLNAKDKTKAEITRENKPKVKIVIGKAKNLSTGSTNFSSIVKTPAVIKRADVLSKLILLISLLNINNEIKFTTNKASKTFPLSLAKFLFLRLFIKYSF